SLTVPLNAASSRRDARWFDFQCLNTTFRHFKQSQAGMSRSLTATQGQVLINGPASKLPAACYLPPFFAVATGSSRMPKTILVLAAVLLVVGDATLSAAEPGDFVDHVLPILQKHCFSCHGEDKQESGLRLDLKKQAFAGGDSGEVIVP